MTSVTSKKWRSDCETQGQTEFIGAACRRVSWTLLFGIAVFVGTLDKALLRQDPSDGFRSRDEDISLPTLVLKQLHQAMKKMKILHCAKKNDTKIKNTIRYRESKEQSRIFRVLPRAIFKAKSSRLERDDRQGQRRSRLGAQAHQQSAFELVSGKRGRGDRRAGESPKFPRKNRR